MKKQWLRILSLVSVGVIGLGIPIANAADCLDFLAGNSYRCEGASGAGGGGTVLFFLDFTAATGDSIEFTGKRDSFDLLCACGYKGDPDTPRFGTDKTVSCVEKPRNTIGYLQSLSFAGQVANRRQIKRANVFEFSTAPSGLFTGGLSAAECTLEP